MICIPLVFNHFNLSGITHSIRYKYLIGRVVYNLKININCSKTSIQIGLWFSPDIVLRGLRDLSYVILKISS